ncbi:acyloxyacyl hydrolase [Roseibacterium sp. SDUM158017]|uniref:acyloxyacyl hydrolase n=1 Tax=Roseicyclus salinarum TaxID=3036773 RepID=UPI0024153ABD|nr:acyloxyacyl hydrolase [Roseibacterium sp. SDUM158017]MDG4650588.1 acyloxyacyl hydrolase [Roseibacterium sp. SDUM158017]
MQSVTSTIRTLVTAVLCLGASAAIAPPAQAQDLSFGLTTDIDTGAFGGVVEVHGAPVFEQPNGFSGRWGVAARTDTDGSAWVGAGFVLNLDVGRNAFVEGSFMPGYYSEGDRPLGGNLHFRSLAGFGWRVSPTGSVVLSLDHISNGGIEDFNPGAETIALRYRMAF